jgi:hypothetical protein
MIGEDLVAVRVCGAGPLQGHLSVVDGTTSTCPTDPDPHWG